MNDEDSFDDNARQVMDLLVRKPPALPPDGNTWMVLQKQLEALQMWVSNDGERKSAIGLRSTKAIDKRCDQWFLEFFRAPRREELTLPNDLQHWLVTRTLSAIVYLEGTCSKTEPPPALEDIEKVMKRLLIDEWYSSMKEASDGLAEDLTPR